MRHVCILIILISSIPVFSQKVLVKGFASDTTKGFNPVSVVLNDTLRKYSHSDAAKWEEYQRLRSDTNYVVETKKNGSFRIWGGRSDSLYFSSVNHITKAYKVDDLLKMSHLNIKLEPKPCVPYVACPDTVPSRTFVFIGEKIKVGYEPEPHYCGDYSRLDPRAVVKYKIIEQVHGTYPEETIKFIAFDHHGWFEFNDYKHVLIFVHEYCKELYHVKYQYFDVYKTADGKWASPGDPYRYDERLRDRPVKAKPIRFADSVWFDIQGMKSHMVEKRYPAAYFKIEAGKAIPVMGSFVRDLLKAKKEMLKYYKFVIH